MVSAVFHSPLDVAAPAHPATLTPRHLAVHRAQPVAAPATAEPVGRLSFDFGFVWKKILPPVLGFAFLVLIWELVALRSTNNFPSPLETWKQALDVFADPFYSKGPNDQGVGWNVLSSLQRVALGFGLAAAVGIPAGFAIGRFEFLSRMFNPMISLLRRSTINLQRRSTVSPLCRLTASLSSRWRAVTCRSRLRRPSGSPQ